MRVGIIEAGSTNTKCYIVEADIISEIFFRNINFKANYKTNGRILEADLSSLVLLIKSMPNDLDSIHIYGTSIFRELSHEIVERLKIYFMNEANAHFHVVTQAAENELTVLGSISCIDYSSNIGVMIGGGGSTEISICNNKKIIEQANTNFGVLDVLQEFPQLANDITDVSVESVKKFIVQRLSVPINKADILILTGGGFLIRYINARYPIISNTLYHCNEQQYMISRDANTEYDEKYYHNISYASLRKFTPDNPSWWDGTRAMCGFVNAVSEVLDVAYIIPTDLTMVQGIAFKIRNYEHID